MTELTGMGRPSKEGPTNRCRRLVFHDGGSQTRCVQHLCKLHNTHSYDFLGKIIEAQEWDYNDFQSLRSKTNLYKLIQKYDKNHQ